MFLVAIGARLRAICLALPEAKEDRMRRGPSYRVANKIFALERPWGDRLALWRQVPEGSREIFLAAGPARFFISSLFWPQGLDRRRTGRRDRLERNRGFRPAQLSAGRAKTARQAHRMKAIHSRAGRDLHPSSAP